MFSTELKEYADQRFKEREKYYKGIKKQLEQGMARCTEEERTLMRFFYGTMPVRDAGEYPFEVFLSYVRHAVWLRRNVSWCAALPEDIFVHHVLYYRINSEDISDCRSFFYELVKDRIRGMSLEQAILEINYWCAEHVVYESTDERTASPVTMYRCGRGRCGEESTFAVSVYRSMGIPARQVYTPRWAHCDDNHAWGEVYLNGQWHYLGACEPEEGLDRGWFAGPASRGILIHSRTFSDFVSDPCEECIGREEQLIFYNSTPTYAEARTLTVLIRDGEGKPVQGAEVFLEILNMAEFYPAARLHSDQDGRIQITLGLGDVLVRAVHNGKFAEKIVNPGADLNAELFLFTSLEEADWAEDEWKQFSLSAPEEDPLRIYQETKEEKQTKAWKTKEAEKRRSLRFSSFEPEGGNAEEIKAFLIKDENPDRRTLFRLLSDKDYKDLKAEILESHLDWRRGEYEREVAEQYLLCPRIHKEELTAFRPFILNYFSQEQQAAFVKKPEEIWQFIQKEIAYDPEVDYKTICATPVGCLRMKQGNETAQKILFVAICRTLGIPARYNRITGKPEYLKEQIFTVPAGMGKETENSTGETARLVLCTEDADKWKYYQNWTIGRLRDTDFETLDYEGIRFEENRLVLTLEPGVYRILTTCRRPDGGQNVSEICFCLKNGEQKKQELQLWEYDMEEGLLQETLSGFQVEGEQGGICQISQICGEEAVLLAFLGVGAEPTEHVLNELLEAKETWNAAGARLIFILRSRKELENATLQKVLKQTAGIEVYFDSGKEHAAYVAGRLKADPEKLPVFAVIDKGMTGVYGLSGYHVGSVELMLRIWKKRS